ncbi:hypothetical protein NA57DRAFT_76677 [Rhizodiscina lignyota]|uniref:Protein-S-isoprenylcysteine O-methyltransferase n=1 Tax=Rhizodiscina lignyota TaxID=1504668 RepID=A0A9P4IGP9_9PEZI|nr:hypothetical protein NA57DRAFT_76677 [Rhizodiscina lignyota]
MGFMASPLSRIVLGLAVFAINVLWSICSAPPQGTAAEPARGTVKDHIGRPIHGGIYQLAALSHATTGLYYAIVIYAYPSPPRLICPQSGFARISNPELFTWSPFLATALFLAIFIAAPIRIAAFRNLGTNFTFMLREPDRLVTTGVHAYMQHPSYTALAILMNAMLWIHVRFDGLAACWIPPSLLQPLIMVQPYMMVGGSIAIMGMFYVRVRDEERMLKASFGKTWEEYNRQTKRFIPGVF